MKTPVPDKAVLRITHPSPKLSTRTCYVDTPGVHSFNEQHDDITYGYLPLVDVAVVVLDATRGDVPGSVLDFIQNQLLQGDLTKLAFAINKTDEVPPTAARPSRQSQGNPQHPDRDAQFQFIAKKVRSFQGRCQPVISVDTKKKELVGDFRNSGREYHKRKTPEQVRCMTSRTSVWGLPFLTASTT